MIFLSVECILYVAMTINEKIRILRKEAKMSLREVHEKIVDLFKDNALSYFTLSNIERGRYKTVRFSSLEQITSALDITAPELFRDVERNTLKVNPHIKRNKRTGKFSYPDGSFFEVITPTDLDFWMIEHTLMPASSSTPEKTVTDLVSIEVVYVVQGRLLCHVEDKTYELAKGDTLSFDNTVIHHYENPFDKKTVFTILQNPKNV